MIKRGYELTSEDYANIREHCKKEIKNRITTYFTRITTQTFIEKKLKLFDKTFHKRIWGIVKQVSPSSYAIAEAYGTLEGDGPQIYGEMREFLSQALTEQADEMTKTHTALMNAFGGEIVRKMAEEILEMEELKEVEEPTYEEPELNQLRSQIKAKIKEKYLK